MRVVAPNLWAMGHSYAMSVPDRRRSCVWNMFMVGTRSAQSAGVEHVRHDSRMMHGLYKVLLFERTMTLNWPEETEAVMSKTLSALVPLITTSF